MTNNILMTGIFRAIYSTFGWEYKGFVELNQPSEKTLRQRHLVLKQIKTYKRKKLGKRREIIFSSDDECSSTEID